jgi:Zn-dependent protease
MNIDIIYIIIVLIVILVSMTLHEAMHAYASYWLGDHTARLQGRLTLNPIKHIDPFLTILLPVMLAIAGGPVFGGAKPVPISPYALRWGEWGMAIVALAGPLTNLLIAFLAYGIWVLVGVPSSGVMAVLLSVTVSVNLGFFVFNMIPIPPLDGSRVIYALAPDFVKRGMEIVEQYGIVIVFAIILLAGSYVGTFISTTTSFFIDLFDIILIR